MGSLSGVGANSSCPVTVALRGKHYTGNLLTTANSSHKSQLYLQTWMTITVTDGYLLRGKSMTVKVPVKVSGHTHADMGVTHWVAMSHVTRY